MGTAAPWSQPHPASAPEQLLQALRSEEPFVQLSRLAVLSVSSPAPRGSRGGGGRAGNTQPCGRLPCDCNPRGSWRRRVRRRRARPCRRRCGRRLC